MKPSLQYFLASINIASTVAYPALDGQYSLYARGLGVLCGLLYWKISPNIFDSITKLNSRRSDLVREVKRLNSEIAILPRKLEDLTQVHQQELNNRESAIITCEKELERQIETANKVLAERQQELAQSVDDANSELEKDKQKFLEETEEAIAQYQSKIDLLESEIDELRSLLAQYEAPALPEGSSFEMILVRHCMELLLVKRVVCEFKGVGIDPDGYVVTRLKPQDGGQKAIEKWANYLHIEMELAEAPKFATLRGAVQIWLKPQEMVRLPAMPYGNIPDGEPPQNPTPNPPNLLYETLRERIVKSESFDNFAETLTSQSFTPISTEPSKEFDERLMRFVEPSAKLPPFGAIRQMERDWIGYLYCFHDPPVRNQKALILRVWGYKSGDSSGYRSARARLRTILIDAGVEIKKKVNHE